MRKIIISIVLVAAMIFAFVGCSEKKDTTKVQMVIKDYGTIVIELNPNEAPLTCENFVNLVNQGFYDGLTFHRVMPGFVLQGGDPEGTSFGGSSLQIKGEFSENGVENHIVHTRGVISMARSTSPNSASSQFFICLDDCRSSLDGKYAAFGQVTEGMDVVDKIVADAVISDPNSGYVLPENQVTIESAKILE